MKLKKLLNADVLKERHENKIDVEHLKDIVPNEPYYVEHSIYFAESLFVFKDESKTESLIEDLDYVFAEMDTIASEQSNKDCYRAIVFLIDIAEAYISYHSYGDIVSAEMLNDIVNEVNAGAESDEAVKEEIQSLKNKLDTHMLGTKEHGASNTVVAETIALRTKGGTVKVAPPTESDDAVNLQHQEEAIETAKENLREDIAAAHQEIDADIERLTKKVKAENDTLEIADFYPDEMTQEDVDELPASERNAIITQATADLISRVNETKPFYNVVRNENGGVTVPDAVKENDAVNKKVLDVVNQKAGDNTIAIENLTEVVSQIDTSSNYTDSFVFDSTEEMGTKIETNKIWNGKKVYRVGVTVEGTGSNNSYWTPISNDYTITNAFGVSVSSSGVSKGISFSDIILAKGNTHPLYYFYVYSERYTTCYLSFEYVE